jgi:hypothetical protein
VRIVTRPSGGAVDDDEHQPRVPVFTAVGYGLTRPIADNKKAPPNGNPDDSARPK